MNRSTAPFWVVDVVGLIVVAVLCVMNKIGSDTTIAIVVTVLGLGAVSRARVRVPGERSTDPPPDDPSASAPITQRPASRRSRTPIPPIGGIVSFFYALAHLRS